MQLIALSAAALAVTALVTAGIVLRVRERGGVRSAVPGGLRRDFFGDASEIVRATTPPVSAVPEPPVAPAPPARRAA